MSCVGIPMIVRLLRLAWNNVDLDAGSVDCPPSLRRRSSRLTLLSFERLSDSSKASHWLLGSGTKLTRTLKTP